MIDEHNNVVIMFWNYVLRSLEMYTEKGNWYDGEYLVVQGQSCAIWKELSNPDEIRYNDKLKEEE